MDSSSTASKCPSTFMIKLLETAKNIQSHVISDLGGGSPVEKMALMSYVAQQRRVRNYVEIGVYRGRSLFPMAMCLQEMGQPSFGIDPYSLADAWEEEINPIFKEPVQDFLKELDFEAIHAGVQKLIKELNLKDHLTLLRQPAAQAVSYFTSRSIPIGMLHIDGNHDERFVVQDVDLYAPLVEKGGIVVMDDTDWEGVKPVYHQLREKMPCIFDGGYFAILVNQPEGPFLDAWRADLARTYEQIRGLAEFDRQELNGPRPKVSVSMVVRNHEKFIRQAIESVLMQQADFAFELIISDDGSTDLTAAICAAYQRINPQRIRLLSRKATVGATANHLCHHQVCRGDYVAYLSGDDFWMDPHKLQKQAAFLDTNPGAAVYCHNVMIMDENGAASQPLWREEPEPAKVPDLFHQTDFLVSSCMVRKDLFDHTTGALGLPGDRDRMSDLLLATGDKVHLMPEAMGAHRIDSYGLGATYSQWKQKYQTLRQKQKDSQAERKETQAALRSAVDWQKRSWIKRAFHRWKPPGPMPK